MANEIREGYKNLNLSWISKMLELNILFAMRKKWPYLSRCAQEMTFITTFVLATGLECVFCFRCAQTLRQ